MRCLERDMPPLWWSRGCSYQRDEAVEAHRLDQIVRPRPLGRLHVGVLLGLLGLELLRRQRRAILIRGALARGQLGSVRWRSELVRLLEDSGLVFGRRFRRCVADCGGVERGGCLEERAGGELAGCV